jgi:glutamine cyclotransferase
LLSFDADTLELTGGTVSSTSAARYALTFDEDGRLFGIGNDVLLEFDPSTLAIANQRAFSGNMHGLAARGGKLYALTNSPASLLSFDADTLELTGGTVSSTSAARYALAFDEDGRLFGIGNDVLLEFDPSTLAIANQRAFSGNMHGLAAKACKRLNFCGKLDSFVEFIRDWIRGASNEPSRF